MISQFENGKVNNDGKVTPSDFSIDHILNKAGNCSRNSNNRVNSFSWLQCTRYSPPKIPRYYKKQGSTQKRQLGKHPRIPFTSHQLSILEQKFHETPYLSSEEVTKLSQHLQLADIRVKIWFQNRRARERREKYNTVNDKLSSSMGVEKSESSNMFNVEFVSEISDVAGSSFGTSTIPAILTYQLSPENIFVNKDNT